MIKVLSTISAVITVIVAITRQSSVIVISPLSSVGDVQRDVFDAIKRLHTCIDRCSSPRKPTLFNHIFSGKGWELNPDDDVMSVMMTDESDECDDHVCASVGVWGSVNTLPHPEFFVSFHCASSVFASTRRGSRPPFSAATPSPSRHASLKSTRANDAALATPAWPFRANALLFTSPCFRLVQTTARCPSSCPRRPES